MSKQMTKSMVVLCCVLALTGCEVTSKLDIAKAKAICENHEGLYSTTDLTLVYSVNCNDGSRITMSKGSFHEHNHPSAAKYLKGIE